MGVLELLMTLWQGIAGFLENVLPRSPFTDITIPQDILTYLGYANWLFPVGQCATLAATIVGFLITVKVVMTVVKKAVNLTEIVHIGDKS